MIIIGQYINTLNKKSDDNMNKSGIVYRHILEQALANRRSKFVEREIARRLGISPDTVNNAVAPLKGIGAVAMYRRHFEVLDFKKLLLFWAVHRKLERDVIYSSYVRIKDVSEIEDKLPDSIAYTEYSAYTKNFGNDASDYSEVYVYADDATRREIARRFPSQWKDHHNLVVLKPDPVLEKRIADKKLVHSSVSMPQMYVDLWNNSTWYAYEFVKKLEKRIDDAYAKAVLE